MFRFISTCAYPNFVHIPNSWIFFFFFFNYMQVLYLEQGLVQFDLLDHRHSQTLRWTTQNSSPFPFAKPRTGEIPGSQWELREPALQSPACREEHRTQSAGSPVISTHRSHGKRPSSPPRTTQLPGTRANTSNVEPPLPTSKAAGAGGSGRRLATWIDLQGQSHLAAG